MNTIKLQYKRETGYPATSGIETELLMQPLDPVMLMEMSRKEIIDCIEHEQPGKWGVFLDNIPIEFHDQGDLELPTSNYIHWLEDKLERLQKQLNKNNDYAYTRT